MRILTSFFFPRHEPYRYVVIAEVYADESESSQKDLLYLGAYLATSEAWLIFNDEWNNTLSKYGIDYFHMKEFRSEKSTLRKKIGSKEKVFDLCNELSHIINSTITQGFIVLIDAVACKKILSNKELSTFGTPIAFAGRFLVDGLKTWAKATSYKNGFNIFFEQGHRNINQLMEYLTILSKLRFEKSKIKINALGIGDYKNFPPLQAADVLVYSAYEKSTRGPRNPFFNLENLVHLILNEDRIKIIKSHDRNASEGGGDGSIKTK